MTTVNYFPLPPQIYMKEMRTSATKRRHNSHRFLYKGLAEVNEIKRTHFSNFAMSDALEKNIDLLLHYLERFKQPDVRITHGASDYVAGFFSQYNATVCNIYYISQNDKCGCVILDFAL